MPRLWILALPVLLDHCCPIYRKLNHHDAMNFLSHPAATAVNALQFVSPS